MTSSLLLTNLPHDSSSALEHAFSFPTAKITVRFQPIGSAPILQRPVSKISSSQSCFAPALDEVVGNLHRCFKDSKDQLIVTYSMTPAFG
ncbi:hypothetical protein SS1G_02277 [Sclerotinia sclerotiorum 1980 UF-70]|uniref:hypothetical protein n=1 Tax=Sclerotinia sclerotiorum (strain ATCC 18683 / 1980 / Ss-1) TaxID=665079 RepID=UPI000159DE89|nr:hypothetical protein SS1G_02277 [Sclerotinia sclerotiorum 1980 UF-70]EDN99423.1 hypothetical protein SS1G_02277 [Sclerotinia sclerotiorum 1980 UF-70]